MANMEESRDFDAIVSDLNRSYEEENMSSYETRQLLVYELVNAVEDIVKNSTESEKEKLHDDGVSGSKLDALNEQPSRNTTSDHPSTNDEDIQTQWLTDSDTISDHPSTNDVKIQTQCLTDIDTISDHPSINDVEIQTQWLTDSNTTSDRPSTYDVEIQTQQLTDSSTTSDSPPTNDVEIQTQWLNDSNTTSDRPSSKDVQIQTYWMTDSDTTSDRASTNDVKIQTQWLTDIDTTSDHPLTNNAEIQTQWLTDSNTTSDCPPTNDVEIQTQLLTDSNTTSDSPSTNDVEIQTQWLNDSNTTSDRPSSKDVQIQTYWMTDSDTSSDRASTNDVKIQTQWLTDIDTTSDHPLTNNAEIQTQWLTDSNTTSDCPPTNDVEIQTQLLTDSNTTSDHPSTNDVEIQTQWIRKPTKVKKSCDSSINREDQAGDVVTDLFEMFDEMRALNSQELRPLLRKRVSLLSAEIKTFMNIDKQCDVFHEMFEIDLVSGDSKGSSKSNPFPANSRHKSKGHYSEENDLKEINDGDQAAIDDILKMFDDHQSDVIQTFEDFAQEKQQIAKDVMSELKDIEQQFTMLQDEDGDSKLLMSDGFISHTRNSGVTERESTKKIANNMLCGDDEQITSCTNDATKSMGTSENGQITNNATSVDKNKTLDWSLTENKGLQIKNQDNVAFGITPVTETDTMEAAYTHLKKTHARWVDDAEKIITQLETTNEQKQPGPSNFHHELNDSSWLFSPTKDIGHFEILLSDLNLFIVDTEMAAMEGFKFLDELVQKFQNIAREFKRLTENPEDLDAKVANHNDSAKSSLNDSLKNKQDSLGDDEIQKDRLNIETNDDRELTVDRYKKEGTVGESKSLTSFDKTCNNITAERERNSLLSAGDNHFVSVSDTTATSAVDYRVDDVEDANKSTADHSELDASEEENKIIAMETCDEIGTLKKTRPEMDYDDILSRMERGEIPRNETDKKGPPELPKFHFEFETLFQSKKRFRSPRKVTFAPENTVYCYDHPLNLDDWMQRYSDKSTQTDYDNYYDDYISWPRDSYFCDRRYVDESSWRHRYWQGYHPWQNRRSHQFSLNGYQDRWFEAPPPYWPGVDRYKHGYQDPWYRDAWDAYHSNSGRYQTLSYEHAQYNPHPASHEHGPQDNRTVEHRGVNLLVEEQNNQLTIQTDEDKTIHNGEQHRNFITSQKMQAPNSTDQETSARSNQSNIQVPRDRLPVNSNAPQQENLGHHYQPNCLPSVEKSSGFSDKIVVISSMSQTQNTVHCVGSNGITAKTTMPQAGDACKTLNSQRVAEWKGRAGETGRQGSVRDGTNMKHDDVQKPLDMMTLSSVQKVDPPNAGDAHPHICNPGNFKRKSHQENKDSQVQDTGSTACLNKPADETNTSVSLNPYDIESASFRILRNQSHLLGADCKYMNDSYKEQCHSELYSMGPKLSLDASTANNDKGRTNSDYTAMAKQDQTEERYCSTSLVSSVSETEQNLKKKEFPVVEEAIKDSIVKQHQNPSYYKASNIQHLNGVDSTQTELKPVILGDATRIEEGIATETNVKKKQTSAAPPKDVNFSEADVALKSHAYTTLTVTSAVVSKNDNATRSDVALQSNSQAMPTVTSAAESKKANVTRSDVTLRSSLDTTPAVTSAEVSKNDSVTIISDVALKSSPHTTPTDTSAVVPKNDNTTRSDVALKSNSQAMPIVTSTEVSKKANVTRSDVTLRSNPHASPTVTSAIVPKNDNDTVSDVALKSSAHATPTATSAVVSEDANDIVSYVAQKSILSETLPITDENTIENSSTTSIRKECSQGEVENIDQGENKWNGYRRKKYPYNPKSRKARLAEYEQQTCVSYVTENSYRPVLSTRRGTLREASSVSQTTYNLPKSNRDSNLEETSLPENLHNSTECNDIENQKPKGSNARDNHFQNFRESQEGFRASTVSENECMKNHTEMLSRGQNKQELEKEVSATENAANTFELTSMVLDNKGSHTTNDTKKQFANVITDKDLMILQRRVQGNKNDHPNVILNNKEFDTVTSGVQGREQVKEKESIPEHSRAASATEKDHATFKDTVKRQAEDSSGLSDSPNTLSMNGKQVVSEKSEENCHNAESDDSEYMKDLVKLLALLMEAEDGPAHHPDTKPKDFKDAKRYPAYVEFVDESKLYKPSLSACRDLREARQQKLSSRPQKMRLSSRGERKESPIRGDCVLTEDTSASASITTPSSASQSEQIVSRSQTVTDYNRNTLLSSLSGGTESPVREGSENKNGASSETGIAIFSQRQELSKADNNISGHVPKVEKTGADSLSPRSNECEEPYKRSTFQLSASCSSTMDEQADGQAKKFANDSSSSLPPEGSRLPAPTGRSYLSEPEPQISEESPVASVQVEDRFDKGLGCGPKGVSKNALPNGESLSSINTKDLTPGVNVMSYKSDPYTQSPSGGYYPFGGAMDTFHSSVHQETQNHEKTSQVNLQIDSTSGGAGGVINGTFNMIYSIMWGQPKQDNNSIPERKDAHNKIQWKAKSEQIKSSNESSLQDSHDSLTPVKESAQNAKQQEGTLSGKRKPKSKTSTVRPSPEDISSLSAKVSSSPQADGHDADSYEEFAPSITPEDLACYWGSLQKSITPSVKVKSNSSYWEKSKTTKTKKRFTTAKTDLLEGLRQDRLDEYARNTTFRYEIDK